MSRKLATDQRGLVSFMITLIMMMVISLIVIGFTQVTNRNRREQLDRQLSMQAFYAAESGVNDAITAIDAKLAAGQPVAEQTNCNGPDYNTSGAAGLISSDPSVDVRYTCILVNPEVPSIVTSPTTVTSSVFQIIPDPTPAVGQTTKLTFTWAAAQGQTAGTGGCSASVGQFPADPYTCPFGLVRLDLMATGGAMNPDSLAANTVSVYMQPLSSGVAIVPTISNFSNPAARAVIAGATYNVAAKTYSATIDITPTISQYSARITMLYRDSPRVALSGTVAGVAVRFKDAQAIIDVTGKAQDVLRRVQVTVPLQKNAPNIPEGAIKSSTDVCKRFSTYTGFFSPANGCSP